MNDEKSKNSEAGLTQDTNLTPEAQAQIGKKLREVYSGMLSDPLPDRFASLLDSLAKSEPKK